MASGSGASGSGASGSGASGSTPAPAEHDAEAGRRTGPDPAAVAEFSDLYPFGLDDFQVRACEALADGKGVLVAAPTGSGKTVVGEFAVHLALARGQKCFYTTPIKALSNQKYADLVRRYGHARVGLLTGDTTVNGEAPVVVMTTEVLRNMLYAASPTLEGLGQVVMDEVHYLSDRFRGAVWEEVILGLPESVALACLSATVSNAEEFADWLVTVRGDVAVVVSEHRPVPLWQHVAANGRLHDLFVDDGQKQVNPHLSRLAREDSARTHQGDRRPPRGGQRPRRVRPPDRVEVLDRLASADLLPAITFIFSRAGCDAAVLQCLRSGMRLTTPAERDRIRAHVETRCAVLPEPDLAVLGYHEWLSGLERGIAAHHAGMLPTFKEVVEELFVAGLVKAVFATETLALGINMPARTVVLERLSKWNGETHADLTPGEYTQLTGRAGRRGIDVEGHAVVLWQPGLDPRAVGGLASTRTYPLRSSFRPSYNMAVNLVGQMGRERATALLESSFAQFQADRAVVGLARQVRRNEEALAGYADAMACDAGDFSAYAALRRALSDREAELARAGTAQRRAAAASSLDRLRPGDVVRLPGGGRRGGLAVVLDPGGARGRRGGARPTVLTAERQVRRLNAADLHAPVEALDRVRLPRGFNPRSPQSRRDLAATLRAAGFDEHRSRARRAPSPAGDDAEIARLRHELRRHPCHGCPDREDHARWAERHHRLRRDTDRLERRMHTRTNSLAATFDRVCAVLEALGYLDGEQVTDPGRRLARLYGELDLLAAECLREGLWDDLGPAELAACVSPLVYESRQPDDAAPPPLPSGPSRDVLAATVRLWGQLDALESDQRLDMLREPDLGFAMPAYAWASGGTLDAVLTASDMPAGDFVRWARQLVDLLGQVGDAAGDDHRLRETARAAVDAVRRGVVATTPVD